MKAMTSVLCVCGVAAALAADTFVGVGEVHTVKVDTDTTLADTLVVAPGGSVVKTGAGTWTVPLANVPQRWPLTLGVREGTLAVQPDDGSGAPFPQPTEVLNRAAIWFDASAAGTVLTTNANDTAYLTAWLDVRETGNATDGYLFPRALPNLLPSGLPPSLVEKEGTTAVYFGGYASGATTDWWTPAGARLILKDNIRHVFLVHGVWDSYGFVLGTTDHEINVNASLTRFHIENASCNKNGLIYRGSYPDAQAPYTGRVFQNGVRVDPCTTRVLQQQFQVQEVDCCGVAGMASNFFNDRNYFTKNPAYPQIDGAGNRIGGDYLAEAVVFTNALTEAERLAVGTWLMEKWLGRRTPNCNVTVADGARVGVDGAALGTVLAAGVGDGAVVKTGAADAEVYSTPANASVAAFAVAEGAAKMGGCYPLMFASGDRYVVTANGNDLPTYTRVADADAGTAVKDGNGTARLTTLAGGISNLVVSAGTLALSGPPPKSNALMPGSVAEAEIPAGDFEDWTGVSTSRGSDEIYAGWHLVGLRGSENNHRDVVIFTSGDGSGSGWSSNTGDYRAPLPAPDASRIMMLKGDSSAWTEVTVPVDGEYVLTFQGSARGDYSGLWVDILIGPSDDQLLPIATVASPSSWTDFSYRTPWLTAGKHQLWFRNKKKGLDKTFALDNVRLAYLPGEARPRMSVPNGSFEATVADFNESSPNTKDNALNWSFIPGEPPEGVTEALPVFLSTPHMAKDYFDHSFNRFGSRQLALRTSGSAAENTFTVSRDGVWRLRLAAAVIRAKTNCAGSIGLTGEIVRGDDVSSLGSVTVTAHHLQDFTLPNAVSLTAGETVTLRLRMTWTYNASSAQSCQAVVDDLVFVDATTSADSVNLITHGDFEGANGWNFVTYAKVASHITGNRIYLYTYCNANFGYAVYEGNYWCAIVQNDITWRTFNVPEAGRYRLTYYAHSRQDNPRGSGDNPVYAFWVDPDEPAKTNIIGRSLVTSTNFVQCTHTFMLPQKDGLIFGLQGGSSHIAGVAELTAGDRTTIVDGVSICRAPDALPDVPENLSVAVATGAKLVLDFDGELTLASCRLGSVGRSGEITAEKYPQYLSGPGRLYVKPRNLVILIR